MKTIGYCFRRSFLHKVGSKSSLKKTMACDHTTTRGSPKRSMSLGGSLVVAAKQEPAVGGETPSIFDGAAGLELQESGATTRFLKKAPMHRFY